MILLLDCFKKTKDLMLIVNDFKLIDFFIFLSKSFFMFFCTERNSRDICFNQLSKSELAVINRFKMISTTCFFFKNFKTIFEFIEIISQYFQTCLMITDLNIVY